MYIQYTYVRIEVSTFLQRSLDINEVPRDSQKFKFVSQKL